VIHAEPAAGPAEPGHHLVGDEQHAVAAADVGDRPPVPVGRLDRGQRRTNDRLGDERGDGAGPGRLEGPVQLARELVGCPERVGAGVARTVRVGGRDMPEPAEPALVGAAERPPAREVERSQRVAVIAPPPREDDPAIRVAARQVEGPRHLERGLDRLGPARHRVDRRVVDRQMWTDLPGVRLERLGREGAAMGVGEPGCLLGHGVGDRPPTVADVDHDRATGRVEVLAARRIPDGRSLPLDRNGRVCGGGPAEDAAGRHSASRWITGGMVAGTRGPSSV
jgi:hypothetical protein